MSWKQYESLGRCEIQDAALPFSLTEVQQDHNFSGTDVV
jgi:hypothetical protein